MGHILRRNCLLKHIIEGKINGRIAVMGRWGGGRKQLLDDLKEKRGYWKLKEEALDRILLRTGFGKDYGPIARQTTKLIKLCEDLKLNGVVCLRMWNRLVYLETD